MKPLSKLFLCISFFLIWSNSASSQVTVRHRLVNNALEIFFLKDFDINSPSSGPPIFFVEITNNGPSREVTLVLTIQSRRRGNLSQGETVPFTLNQNQVLNLSNNNLFSNTGPYRFERYRIDEDVVGELLKDILSTGKLPSDIYTFNIEVRQNQAPLDQDSFDIRVSNPQKIDLIFPGRPATGSRDDCQEIFTNLPQFRWESDMTRFRVIIAEARPGEDPESALNQSPRFTRVFIIQSSGNLGVLPDDFEFTDRVDVLPSTSFQYPSSGEVLTFRPGKTYYWRVIGIVESSSGPITQESEIFCFRMARLDQLGSGRAQFEFILRNLLGPDYETLFGEGGEFEGYRAKRLYLDDKEITPAELVSKMQKLQAQYSGYRVEK